MKHFEVKIIRPFVLNEGEKVDIETLKSELLEYKVLSKSSKRDFGLYVYRKGYDYPHSSIFGISHTWHNGEKFLEHIDKNICMHGKGKYVVCCEGTKVGLEKLN